MEHDWNKRVIYVLELGQCDAVGLKSRLRKWSLHVPVVVGRFAHCRLVRACVRWQLLIRTENLNSQKNDMEFFFFHSQLDQCAKWYHRKVCKLICEYLLRYTQMWPYFCTKHLFKHSNECESHSQSHCVLYLFACQEKSSVLHEQNISNASIYTWSVKSTGIVLEVNICTQVSMLWSYLAGHHSTSDACLRPSVKSKWKQT